MKYKTVFICSQCGHIHSKWQGQCSSCGKWNTLVEDVYAQTSKSEKKQDNISDFSFPPITMDKDIENDSKIETGIEELDRVLGDGIIRGQVLLLAGPPGIGKSTLMLETADGLSKNSKEKVLYISGEESSNQVLSRAKRLEIKNEKITLISETNLYKIIEEIKKTKPFAAIIDSIQTVYHPDIPSTAGSITQIRECAIELSRIAKSNSMALFILGHITKEGDLAGPKILEHMVDTVLYFDSEKTGLYRMLRAHKNRFGAIEEIGIFEMTEKGLFSAGNYFNSIIGENANIPGGAYTTLFEGSRVVIARVEALVNKTFYPYPRRVFTGIDSNKGQILIAALEKNARIRLDTFDIFASIHGGFKTKDTALDLAFCAAVSSSLKEMALPNDWAFIGEVGILAQISPVSYLPKRINELKKMGFKKVFVSALYKEKSNQDIEIIRVNDIKQLLEYLYK